MICSDAEAETDLLWIYGQLCHLRALGLVGGGDVDMTTKGMSEVSRLELSGYRPRKEVALDALQEFFGDDADSIWILICARLDDPNFLNSIGELD